MQDVLSMISTLHRPRLLIRAARIGARDYRRERHLKRLLGYGALPRPASALMRLIELERGLNEQRRDGEAGYLLTRHLDVLIAMMGEVAVLRASRGPVPATGPVT
jgi:Family of unknown function (DUF6477)